MIVLIDNYDSFTFNLYHYLGGLGADVAVYRNDKITAERVMTMDPDAIVLSPGPCTPNDAGICLELIAKAAQTVPVLGVCLGHQAIGQAFGGDVVRAPVSPRSSTPATGYSAASTGDSRPRATIRWWSNGRACRRSLR